MTTLWLPTGTVYGTLMNFPCEHAALAAHMHDKPYSAPPKAPVLFIKTANTFSANGAAIVIPSGVDAVQVRASVFMVFLHNVSANGSYIATHSVAFGLMNDVTVPHASFYRPPVKTKCVDGFLGVAAPHGATLDTLAGLTLQVRINGVLVQSIGYTQLLRSAAQLIADASEFADFRAGDVLMPGYPFDAPLARVGDVVEISAPGFETLRNTFASASQTISARSAA
jgi:5-oxopent-3-ene-1,2,5-tricarboxylate decarboxylase / 2-hydroxyhepta-2,4-diene-1,7-dioate isomerase